VTRWFAYTLVWLALVTEIEGVIYGGIWTTPLTPITTFIFTPIKAIHVIPWDALVCLTTLIAAPRASWRGVQPITRSILITLAATAFIWLWGVARGGSAYQTIFQLRPFLLGLVVVLMLLATCKTMAHVETLLRVVVFATVYRASVLIIFYLLVARHLEKELPTLTDHVDSVLFVSGLFIILINALERRTLKTWLYAIFGIVVIVTAIALNGRRIAWLGAGVGVAMLYLVMPPGRLKKRVKHVLIALSPLIVAYVAAGWGRPVGIFKPVGSISSMFGEHQDVSSIMRDIENYNLTRTLKTSPLFGTGWGHEYVEEVQAWDISSIFPQYRYLPHNSFLGLIAFTGMFGFAATFQIVPVAAFLHARILVHAASARVARIAAQSSLLALMMVVIEMWGDVGFNHTTVTTMMGVGIALGGRVAALMGVSTAPRRQPQPSEPRRTEPSEARQDVENRDHVDYAK
jgi:hypothetical protein